MSQVFQNPKLVLIIDYSPLTREALKLVLNRISSSHITVEVTDIHSADQKLKKYQLPDLIIYHLYQIDDEKVYKLSMLKMKYAGCKLVVISNLPKPVISSFSISVNADLYFHQTASLDSIYAGLYPLLNLHSSQNSILQKYAYLSRRQIQLLSLVEQGLSNENIATYLKVEIGTVKTHLTRIFKSLGVTSRSQAVFVAKHKNLI